MVHSNPIPSYEPSWTALVPGSLPFLSCYSIYAWPAHMALSAVAFMETLLFAGLDFLLFPGDHKLLEGRDSEEHIIVEEPQRTTCSDRYLMTVPRAEGT